MSEQVEVETTEANPYNMKKDWHTPDGPSMGTADGLFFEPKQATSEEENESSEAAPEKKAKKKSSDYKKRYDDLKKHYDQRISEFKQKELELQAAASGQAASAAPPKTAEELESFKEKYPDLYETVETVAHLRTEQQTEALKAKLAILEEREASISRKEAEEGLRSKHPDFDELRGSDEFHAWAEEQPEQIQDWIYRNPNNVTLAIKAIDLYKLEKGISPKRKASKSQSTGSAADMVSTKTTQVDSKEPKIWTRREIAALSMNDYDKFEEEIDLAVKEGRVRP
jgi:hypothetical protein